MEIDTGSSGSQQTAVNLEQLQQLLAARPPGFAGSSAMPMDTGSEHKKDGRMMSAPTRAMDASSERDDSAPSAEPGDGKDAKGEKSDAPMKQIVVPSVADFDFSNFREESAHDLSSFGFDLFANSQTAQEYQAGHLFRARLG